MKLLISLGNGKVKVIDHVTHAEQFADFHRTFTPSDDGTVQSSEATITLRYWLIYSEDLRKPIRCNGFEVIQEHLKCGNCGADWNGKTCSKCGYPVAVEPLPSQIEENPVC